MRLSASVLAIGAVLALASAAHAGDADDTVLLTNGGRVRGTVLEEDPTTGVRLRMPDGKVRTFKKAQVKSVKYGGEAADAQPAPAAPPTSAPVVSAPPEPARAPDLASYGGQPAGFGPSQDQPVPKHRRVGLLVTGIVAMGAGVILLPIGGAVFAINANKECQGSSGGFGSTPLTTYSYKCGSDGEAAGGATMGVGGGLLAVGTVFFILGVVKVKDKPAAGATAWSVHPTVAQGRYGLGITMPF
jgi:hypothetical protein